MIGRLIQCIGLCLAAYLVLLEANGVLPICGLGQCSKARYSDFAELGGIPIIYFSVPFWLIALVVGILEKHRFKSKIGSQSIAFIGLGVAVTMASISIWQKINCPYCYAMQVLLASNAVYVVFFSTSLNKVSFSPSKSRLRFNYEIASAAILLGATFVLSYKSIVDWADYQRQSSMQAISLLEKVAISTDPGTKYIVLADPSCGACRKHLGEIQGSKHKDTIQIVMVNLMNDVEYHDAKKLIQDLSEQGQQSKFFTYYAENRLGMMSDFPVVHTGENAELTTVDDIVFIDDLGVVSEYISTVPSVIRVDKGDFVAATLLEARSYWRGKFNPSLN